MVASFYEHFTEDLREDSAYQAILSPPPRRPGDEAGVKCTKLTFNCATHKCLVSPSLYIASKFITRLNAEVLSRVHNKKKREYRTRLCSALNVCGESRAWNVNYLTTIYKYVIVYKRPHAFPSK